MAAWMKTRPARRAMKIGIVTLLLFAIVMVQQYLTSKDADGQTLYRNTYGAGAKEENLEVSVEGELEEPLTVTVEEQEYEQDQLEAVFAKSIKELEKIMLGDNESPDQVRSDLNLVDRLPDSSIQVSWELDNYEVMNLQGQLQADHIAAGGTPVELRALLSYKEEEALHIFSVCIYPPMQTKQEQLLSAIEQAVKSREEETRRQSSFTLPHTVEGKTVRWQQEGDNPGPIILGMGAVLILLMFALERQNQAKKEQEREKEMLLDYPRIVHKFTILLGAGMTVKNVWKKIVEDYVRQRDSLGVRQAYEEMTYTLHEMQGKVPEGECYERFGYRCRLQPYLKLGALLSQNLRKGTKGLAELMNMEAVQAFEERKGMAKKLGEEASTKLLMPMFFMLAIVLVIVIVPAFFSIQM